MDGNQPQPSIHRNTPTFGSLMATIMKIIWVIIMIIVVLLSVRVVLSLIGANPDNDFATFIYNITYPFDEPFRGLLQVSETQIGVIRIEYETIVAIVVYLLFGAGLTTILNAFRR